MPDGRGTSPRNHDVRQGKHRQEREPVVAIRGPGGLSKFAITTITFEDVAGFDGKEFGQPTVGQPYAQLGVVIVSGAVAAHANLNSSSRGVAIRGYERYDRDHVNELT